MFKESKIRILQLGFSILHFWTYVDETAHVSFLAGVHKTNILHDGGSLQTSVRIPLWSVPGLTACPQPDLHFLQVTFQTEFPPLNSDKEMFVLTVFMLPSLRMSLGGAAPVEEESRSGPPTTTVCTC